MAGSWFRDDIKANLYHLCDCIGERVAGGPAEGEAALFIAALLRQYGAANVELQAFPVRTWVPEYSRILVDGCDRSWNSMPLAFAHGGWAAGRLVDMLGAVFPEEEGERLRLESSVLLIDSSTRPPFYEGPALSLDDRLRPFADCGCSGIIVQTILPKGGVVQRLSVHDERFAHVPICAVSFEDGERLQRHVASTEAIVSMDVRAGIEDRTSRNVIAEIPGRTPEVVLVGAHYDTVDGSPGAIDNGSGVVVLLEIFRLLSQYASNRTLDRSVRFVLFGAEEQRLQGSMHYVDTLDTESYNKIKLMIGLDEVAAGRMKGYVLGTSSRTKDALDGALGRAGSLFCSHMRRPHVIDTSGDSYSFARRGTEVIGLWRWRYRGESPYRQYRHTEFDTPDKVDLRDLRECANDIAGLIIELVGMPRL